MMAEFRENVPVYSLLQKIKNDEIEKSLCFFPFGFRKGKTENFGNHLRAISGFFF